MNKICSCPVGSLFASIMHLYRKELIINGLPLAFCSLSHSQKEFCILSSLDHLLLILKRKMREWGDEGGVVVVCFKAEICHLLNSFRKT